MSIKVEVKSAEVFTKSGNAKASGKPYEIRTQEGYAFTVGRDGKPRPYPEKVEVPLDKDQQPYKPGVYEISPSSFYVGDFFRLSCFLRLVPAKA